MSHILIAPYADLEETVRRHRPSHLVTLMIEPFVETPKAIHPDHHLRIGVHDVIEPSEGSVVPEPHHIAEMLAFAKNWDRRAPFLVHCWAGISRSTAAAYIVLCNLHGQGHELHIARALRFRAPHAQPNPLMIRHADRLLGREGRMIAGVEAMGEGRPNWQSEIVELPLDLDLL
ncbi:MAG TPA: protein-tyrosine phosphatase family protein [Micropepsaceae bacterium]|jgi:predicted protein tyrosine phosphatase